MQILISDLAQGRYYFELQHILRGKKKGEESVLLCSKGHYENAFREGKSSSFVCSESLELKITIYRKQRNLNVWWRPRQQGSSSPPYFHGEGEEKEEEGG